MNSDEHEQTAQNALFTIQGWAPLMNNFQYQIQSWKTILGKNLSVTLNLANQQNFSYGQLLALAGDYVAQFADLKASNASDLCDLMNAKSWHAGDCSLDWVFNIPPHILELYSFYKLLILNPEHFRGPPQIRKDGSYTVSQSQNALDPGYDDSVLTYQHGHALAMNQYSNAKTAADQLDAYALNAFYDHFLTDMFSAGHMRVPRRQLHSKNGMTDMVTSHLMHQEDGDGGLYVYSKKFRASFAMGDGFQNDVRNRANWNNCLSAVKASVSEVTTGQANKDALSMVPDVFPPGAMEIRTDSQIGDYNVQMVRDTNKPNDDFKLFISDDPDSQSALLVPSFLDDVIKGFSGNGSRLLGGFKDYNLKTVNRNRYWIKTALINTSRSGKFIGPQTGQGSPHNQQTYPLYIIANDILYLRVVENNTTSSDGSDITYVTAEYNSSKPMVSDGFQVQSITVRLKGHQQGW